MLSNSSGLLRYGPETVLTGLQRFLPSVWAFNLAGHSSSRGGGGGGGGRGGGGGGRGAHDGPSLAPVAFAQRFLVLSYSWGETDFWRDDRQDRPKIRGNALQIVRKTCYFSAVYESCRCCFDP